MGVQSLQASYICFGEITFTVLGGILLTAVRKRQAIQLKLQQLPKDFIFISYTCHNRDHFKPINIAKCSFRTM